MIKALSSGWFFSSVAPHPLFMWNKNEIRMNSSIKIIKVQTSNMKIHFGVHSYKVNHLTMMHNTECKNQNKDFITSIHKIIPPLFFYLQLRNESLETNTEFGWSSVRNRLVIGVVILPESQVETRNLITGAGQNRIGITDRFESAQLDFIHCVTVSAQNAGKRHVADGCQLLWIETQLPVSCFVPETVSSFQASKLVRHDAAGHWTQSTIIHRNLRQQSSVQIDISCVPTMAMDDIVLLLNFSLFFFYS